MDKTPEELAKQYCDQFSWNDPREEDALEAFIAGYQAAAPQWISVKDRLPEDGVKVLVVSDGETGASWHEAGEFGWAIGGTVTHWAPLPAAPKEEV